MDRLAKKRWQDEEAEVVGKIALNRAGGKKLGCMLVAAETVDERIDWPHMYVTRATGGRRKGVAYNELTAEELAYGFACMLQSPWCK